MWGWQYGSKVRSPQGSAQHLCAWCTSEFSSWGLFHECSHVQQGILYGLGQLCRLGFLTGDKGWHRKVDVIIHRVVAHAVSIGNDGAKTHDAVCLGWHLATRMLVTKMFQLKAILEHISCWYWCISSGSLPFLGLDIPDWWTACSVRPYCRLHQQIWQVTALCLQELSSLVPAGVCQWPGLWLPGESQEIWLLFIAHYWCEVTMSGREKMPINKIDDYYYQ